MSDEKNYGPYDSFRQMSEMWEKGLNGALFKSINNNDLIRMTKLGIDAHSRYMEFLKRNQELWAHFMNIPTKSDVANVAKLTVQAEEKVDILEQQLWNLNETMIMAGKEQHRVMEELMEYTKQIHTEWLKTSQQLTQLAAELAEMKELLKKKEEEAVPVVAGAAQ